MSQFALQQIAQVDGDAIELNTLRLHGAVYERLDAGIVVKGHCQSECHAIPFEASKGQDRFKITIDGSSFLPHTPLPASEP